MITYHDPCHLKKSLGVSDQPHTLLKSLSGYRFREMAKPETCCGCGGSFLLKQYESSKAVGERKRDNILKSGAEVVATACPACLLQLSDLFSRGGDKIRVRQVIELFAENLPVA